MHAWTAWKSEIHLKELLKLKKIGIVTLYRDDFGSIL